MIKELLTGAVVTTLLKYWWVLIIVFVMYQCNRGCNKSEHVVESSLFDYSTIALAIPAKDTIPVDTLYAKEDLQKIIPGEMIEFTKEYSDLFVAYLRKKYVVENGLIIKK